MSCTPRLRSGTDNLANEGGRKGPLRGPFLPSPLNIYNGPRAQPRGVIDILNRTTVIGEYKLGLLLNFHTTKMKDGIKRIVNGL
jgi:hypothetical protein